MHWNEQGVNFHVLFFQVLYFSKRCKISTAWNSDTGFAEENGTCNNTYYMYKTLIGITLQHEMKHAFICWRAQKVLLLLIISYFLSALVNQIFLIRVPPTRWLPDSWRMSRSSRKSSCPRWYLLRCHTFVWWDTSRNWWMDWHRSSNSTSTRHHTNPDRGVPHSSPLDTDHTRNRGSLYWETKFKSATSFQFPGFFDFLFARTIFPVGEAAT